jgi:endonuclease-8
MPEGDSIHRIARALDRDLVGKTLDRVETHDQGVIREFAGRKMAAATAHGKHLVIEFEGDWSLRVHLGMYGRWRRFSSPSAVPPNHTALLVAGGFAWACHRAYGAELVRTNALRTHPRLSRLGPDLLAPEPDFDAMIARAQIPAHGDREIAELLLDQRIASGMGNVYKSEVLFAERVHPRTLVRDVDTTTLRSLFTTAARLMRRNLLTRRRESVPLRRRPEPNSARLHVYGRAGKPCLECGSRIVRVVQGDMARSTYFCPACQGIRATAETPRNDSQV